jgi:hypothetical protein
MPNLTLSSNRLLSANLIREATRAVDVGEAATAPVIVRGGVALTAPTFDTKKVADLISTLPPIVRVALPRAVSQSIPGGTRVPKGTPVDIVLVAVTDIPFSVIDGVHIDLAQRSLADVQPVLLDPKVAAILNKNVDASQVSDADKQILTGVLQTQLNAPGNPFVINDQVPASSFATAFQSLKMAQAFQ